jgi:succinate-acetate transporter protein
MKVKSLLFKRKEFDMNTSQIFIAVFVITLAIVALLVFFVSKNRKENRLTPLASLAFTFTVLGIVFSDDRLIGYSLMGVGVLLAVVDMYNRSKQK